MLLANDCEHPDKMGDPRANSTGLPELRGYDTERDADGSVSTVSVHVELTSDHFHRRHTVSYRVDDGHATPRRVTRRSSSDAPIRVETYLTALLAAEEAISRLPDITSVEGVDAIASRIWDRDPVNGYQPVGASEDDVEQAIAEVSD